MKCDDVKPYLMSYLDGEIEPEKRSEIERHLTECPNCREEYQAFVKLKQETDKMRLADLSDELWRSYWKGIYRRVERGAGWIFLSIGAIILLSFGAYQFFRELLADPNISLIVKAGLSTGALGAIILLISIIRERLFLQKTERYKEVER
ncbi:MAG: zf-HC2 domain-containing protein [Candidatus Zixiibacteriota bacterium]